MWKPFDSVSYWLNNTSRALQRAQDARMKALGFGISHMTVLNALADGSSRSQRELATLARVEQPTMAELLNRLEKSGIVKRRPNPKDARASLVSLTAKAKRGWPRAQRALLDVEAEATSRLSAREKATLVRLLRRVFDSVEGEGCAADVARDRRRAKE